MSFNQEQLEQFPSELGNGDVYRKILSIIEREGVPFEHKTHPPTLTSEQSAQARGCELKIGGKTLLIRVDGVFRLFVISAAKKLDSSKIKKLFGTKNTRFASREELAELTGLVSGSVPPFGEPILPFPLYVDRSISENERIAFNAGLLVRSVIMDVKDYLELARPEIIDCAET